MPEAVDRGMQASIGRLVLRLQRKVRQDKLTGQVLKVRTGTLRRSIDQVVFSEPGAVIGIVSTNVKYGKAHEYGFHGSVNVKAHLRHLRKKSKMSLTTVKGHDMQVWTKRRGGLTGGVAQVRAHTRNVDLPARSFLRSALRDMAPEIKADMTGAINGAISK